MVGKDRSMHNDLKQSLRYIAAARYYLPVTLATPSAWEAEYQEYLHHSEFGLALEKLADIGSAHSGYSEETLFWEECLLAAEHMKMDAESARCRAKLLESKRAH